MENLPEQKKTKSGFKKFLFILLLFLLVGFGSYGYWKYYYVFGEGVKSGYLNFAVKKGNIFKTYEGKLIQEGFGSVKTGGIASNQFEFSIEDDSIFRQLELNSGKYFDLQYKEYHGVLPWRGNTVYVVDKIINMK
ncbi:hypothetical protein D3C87_812850 [compost metagenome]|jgi:hypothetical protein|uniref:6-phosphogluconate dehydrogenase n=2 Tax=Sphingobacterium TaxID=28453 RepID=A0A420W250_9SPHI|nr:MULTISPECIES: hypothetical protein [Sphingobacterium]MCS4223957.1 hypothetical protein [Sphingobacterium sp. BIGb0165]RKO72652.1 hypothetical protein D7322_04175 [Sphingobacterium puteale]